MPRRVEGKGVDDKEGPPGREPSCDRNNPLDLDPACAPLTSEKTPGVAEQQVAPQQEAAVEGAGAPGKVSAGWMEVDGATARESGFLS